MQILTAIDQSDGGTVYFVDEDIWSDDLDIAWTAENAEDRKLLMEYGKKAEIRGEIRSPRLMQVTVTDRGLQAADREKPQGANDSENQRVVNAA